MPYLPADPPLTIADLARVARGAARRAAPHSFERGRFFGAGRAALLAALRGFGIGPGDRVLLPAYLCESVVTPVVVAGAEPAFYPIGRDLHPDLSALARAIDGRTRAVMLIHYFGFPGPVEQVRQLCDARGARLIEDCAHALYSRDDGRPLGSFGAAAIFSPWKSLPMPDGGVLVLNEPVATPAPDPAPSVGATALRTAYRALGALEASVGWSPRLWLLRRPGLRRDLHDRTSGAPVRSRAGSSLSWGLLRSADSEQIVARRRANYDRLLASARGLSWARPLFDRLPPGVCPLGLPLVAEERDRWRDRLLALGINVRTYWEQLPDLVDLARFPDARWLRDRILVLPVHQALGSAEVDWMARRLLSLDTGKAHAALAHR